MSTRRSKRKPQNQLHEEGIGHTADKKSKEALSTEKPPKDGSGRGGRRPARRKKMAVSYRETGNSDDDDFVDAQDDPEYTASSCDEERKPPTENGSTRGRRQMRKVVTRGADKESESGSEPEHNIKKEVFEVSKLKTEINLSSDDDDSEDEEKVAVATKSRVSPPSPAEEGQESTGKVTHIDAAATTTSSPYFHSKKQATNDNSIGIAKQSENEGNVRVRTLSGKLKEKQSLFDETLQDDPEEAMGEHKEGSPVKKLKLESPSDPSDLRLGNVSGENLSGESDGESAKDGTDGLLVQNVQTSVIQSKNARERKNLSGAGVKGPPRVPAQKKGAVGQSENFQESKRPPRRACRKSPVKGTRKAKTGSTKVKGADDGKKKSGKCRVEPAKKKKPQVKDEGITDEDVKLEGPGHPAGSGGDMSESSDDEWEDVEDVHFDGSGSPRKKKTEKEPVTAGVEIDIELPGADRKRKKEYDWADYYRRELNKVKKERQVKIHKVHLLCLLASGFHRNTVCNDDLLLSTALSIIPPDVAKARPKNLNMNFVYKLLFWYRKHFGINASLSRTYKYPVYQLLQGMQSGVFTSEQEFVMVFVLCIRSLWGDARLVISLQPITWKAEIIEKSGKIKKTILSSPKSASAEPAQEASCKKADSKGTQKAAPVVKTAKSASAKPASKTCKKAGETLVAVRMVKTTESVKRPSATGSTKQKQSSRSKIGPDSSIEMATKDLSKRGGKLRSVKEQVVPEKEVKESRGSKIGQRTANKRTVGMRAAGSGKETAERVKTEKGGAEAGYEDRRDSDVPRGRQSTKGYARKSDKTEDMGDSGTIRKRRGMQSNRSKHSDQRVTRGQRTVKAEASGDTAPISEVEDGGRNGQRKGGGGNARGEGENNAQVKMAGEDRSRRPLRKRQAQKTPPARRKVQSPDDESDQDKDDNVSDEGSNYSEEEWIHQKKASRKKKRKKSITTPSTSKGSPRDGESSDSDFEEEIENLSMNKSPPSSRSKKKNKLNNSVLSSDSEESMTGAKCNNQKKAAGVDVWCEVFLPAQNMWVSVDCMQGYVNKPYDLETRATQPLLYVIGFDNDNSVKDVTQRYASRWMSHNIKLRIEEDWWQQTILAYKSKKNKRDKDEDAKMQNHQLDQPLPKSIVEYKNHPLYALERHLLKFEAIYPPSAAVLGYCKGEPVYSRECVHTLKSSHTWMKEGIAVKDGEKPFKFVKKLVNPFKRHLLTPEEQNQMLDIYGEWQTELFVPPPAKDGIVPRNEYGNVELFKPSMLPKGTVHLKIPGLNKVASKLDIDCAPAMMGWEFHKRFACPILEGFVVCEEVADVLIAAWQEEQVEIEKKKKMKREQKAMKNWQHLIKSVLIRERLKERYQLEEEPTAEPNAKGKGKGKKTKAYWPQNKMTSFKGDTSNLLPFEKK